MFATPRFSSNLISSVLFTSSLVMNNVRSKSFLFLFPFPFLDRLLRFIFLSPYVGVCVGALTIFLSLLEQCTWRFFVTFLFYFLFFISKKSNYAFYYKNKINNKYNIADLYSFTLIYNKQIFILLSCWF